METKCGRCGAPMEFLGEKWIHEGENYGVFGDFGEWFTKRLEFDVFCCRACGSIEFFLPGYRRRRIVEPEPPREESLTWKCSRCGEINIRSAEACKSCQIPRHYPE